MNDIIPFNKPYITGKEYEYIQDAVSSLKISGNGKYTNFCHDFFEKNYGFGKCLLTTSCTDALEMAALLLEIGPGDEVIMPSYTFVSTANAFVLRGAKIRFVDSRSDHPGLDEDAIEELITANTKAIVVVHYAGVACDMDKVMEIARRHAIFVVEDAAQAIDSYYKGRPLGGIGHLAAFSFHETKNIISGEGGMLVINDKRFEERSEIIWEKGTNRSAFFRGEVNKYGWVDVGSSFLPSEIIAAFLFAQLENLESIQKRRRLIWEAYHSELKEWAEYEGLQQPIIPKYATNNAHMYYLTASSEEDRDRILSEVKSKNVLAVFHYLSLHKSDYFKASYSGNKLINCERYSSCLIRLPLFYELDFRETTNLLKTI